MFSKLSLCSLVFVGSLIGLARAFTGEMTWYNINQHNAPGACGQMHYDNEYVVALAFGTFDTFPGAGANPNENPICGKKLKATYQGKSIVVKVVDRCADCMIATNIDVSPTAFQQISDLGAGRLFGVEWDWTDLPEGPVTDAGPPPPQGAMSRDVVTHPRRMLKAPIRRATSHQGTEEPVARDARNAVTKVAKKFDISSVDTREVGEEEIISRGLDATSRSDGPTAHSHWSTSIRRWMLGHDMVKRSTIESAGQPEKLKRRFGLKDPIRLRRFYEAVRERDANRQIH